jgi:integrase
MPTIPFNVRKIDSLKLPDRGRVDYWDEDTPGFGLRLSDKGSRTWMVMYRVKGDGRQRRLKIGTYPTMPLADARDEAREALRAAQKGQDPARERDALRAADTVKALADLYIEKYAKPSKRSWAMDQRMLNKDVIPAWGPRKACTIRRRDVIELLDEVAKRGPIMANRTYEVIRTMFRFAVERDIVDASPCIGVTKPGTEKARERVLTEDEIRKVWAAMESEKLREGAVLKLRLITAQRGAEVRGMRWSDIDPAVELASNDAWWTIPAEVAKNGKAHRVPLSAMALDILRMVRASHRDPVWVFKRPIKGGTRWLPGNRVREKCGVDFVPHDLRRTAASLMTGMGITRLTVSKILNHSEAGTTKVYDRHSYDAEKRAALEAWSVKLQAILKNEKPAANVVELKRA